LFLVDEEDNASSVVTGASNGIGLSMINYLLAKGDTVIAAVRRPESMQELQVNFGANKLLVVKVNVQNQEDVDTAFKKAKTTFGRIDVVYNNAGYSAVGEVEAMPMSDGKDMFEVQ
jgi:NADP-dependent 3-hydroxy acid dehydrogenase YdfG